MAAGFDGVQILANYLYLISQFLNATTNLRKDEYGGSLENRSRFLFKVVEAVLSEVDAQRVGVKISPMHEGGAFQANDETLPVREFTQPGSSRSQTSPLRPKLGTRFVREWQGKLHEVSVLPEGYEYNDRTFASLSEIAREITGTRWSGPAFFGLRRRGQEKTA